MQAVDETSGIAGAGGREGFEPSSGCHFSKSGVGTVGSAHEFGATNCSKAIGPYDGPEFKLDDWHSWLDRQGEASSRTGLSERFVLRLSDAINVEEDVPSSAARRNAFGDVPFRRIRHEIFGKVRRLRKAQGPRDSPIPGDDSPRAAADRQHRWCQGYDRPDGGNAGDGGKFDLAQVLVLQDDLPSSVFINRQAGTLSRSKSFSPLADARWITVALAYLKEMDTIQTKRQELAAAKPRGDAASLHAKTKAQPFPKKKKWKANAQAEEGEEDA